MNDLISIIVPVFNVEDYLEKCLSSLLIQTYRNLQIILIDDGSTDSSGKICDRYRARDERIVLYHLENKGVSEARNYGLDRAAGKYVFFVDSDDFLEYQAIETLYTEMKNNDVDLVECSYFKNYIEKKEEVIHPRAKISGQTAVRSLLLWDGYLTPFCWDKLYIKDKIRDLRFDSNLKIGEDALFVYEYLLKCDNVLVTEKTMCNYRIREDSAIGNVYTRKKMDSVRAAERISTICKDRNVMYCYDQIHVGLAAFFSYANMLNTIPYTKLNEFKSDCEFYVSHMKKCSFILLYRFKNAKVAILYKIAQYLPLIYKASGIIRKKKR